jgi:hypothetical protein
MLFKRQGQEGRAEVSPLSRTGLDRERPAEPHPVLRMSGDPTTVTDPPTELSGGEGLAASPQAALPLLPDMAKESEAAERPRMSSRRAASAGGRQAPDARRSAPSVSSGWGRRLAQQRVGDPSAASPHAAARPRGTSREFGIYDIAVRGCGVWRCARATGHWPSATTTAIPCPMATSFPLHGIPDVAFTARTHQLSSRLTREKASCLELA